MERQRVNGLVVLFPVGRELLDAVVVVDVPSAHRRVVPTRHDVQPRRVHGETADGVAVRNHRVNALAGLGVEEAQVLVLVGRDRERQRRVRDYLVYLGAARAVVGGRRLKLGDLLAVLEVKRSQGRVGIGSDERFKVRGNKVNRRGRCTFLLLFYISFVNEINKIVFGTFRAVDRELEGILLPERPQAPRAVGTGGGNEISHGVHADIPNTVGVALENCGGERVGCTLKGF